MSYKVVKGHFKLFYKKTRHVGSRPDGDSIWFTPNNPDLLSSIGDPPRSASFNGGDFAQLRFEGIDALELHYKGSNHQLKQGCVSARDRMLGFVGFNDVEYAPDGEIPTYVRNSAPQSIPGYILTRNIDPFGRPVSFVFSGDALQTDGASTWLDTNLLNSSINARLMAAGEVYPAYYTGLPSDLRNQLTTLAGNAKRNHLSVWSVDTSLSGSKVRRIDDLEKLAIWPKLYRRLFSFFRDGNRSIKKFDGWLRESPTRDDKVWIISQAHLGNIHDILKVSGNNIEMVYSMDDLVIVPR